MKRIYILTIVCGLMAMSTTAQTRQLFDDNWEFSRNGKTGQVNLPHDWDIYLGPDPATGATGTGGGWFAGGSGEYRKRFATPDAEVVKLHFEGVYQKAEVYVNGQKAGQHAYGYTPFTVDVTPFLHRAGTAANTAMNSRTNRDKQAKSMNEVQVKVNNTEQPNCRWYSGSGIYRHVWLETMPSLHIAENGIFITTRNVSEGRATMQVDVTVKNESDRARQATVVVGNAQLMVSLDARQEKTVTTTFTVQKPRLWSPDSPALYEVAVSLREGEAIIDRQTAKYGIRTFTYDAGRGFVLNGQPVLINGACVHHDDGVLGAMAFDAAEIRKVRLMKEAGFNLIRTSHNPTTRAFLDACDSLGLLVIGEAFDGWRTAKNPYDYATVIDSCYREDIHAMVKRDRNHPSIISWSIGNEVMERKDIQVVTTARRLKAAILECDTTRPVTEALCAWDSDWEIYDPHFEVLDIGGYNYMIHKHATDHQRDPQRVMWQTESFPRDAFRNWAVVNDYPYVIGDIVWTGLDYLGESGIGRNYYEGERPGEHYVDGGQPDWHGAYCGDVDITGWRKPISHYREMLWKTPLLSTEGNVEASTRGGMEGVYLCVKEPNGYHGKIHTTAWSVWPTAESWTWPGWEGKPIEVEVYTKAPEVKLFLNDRLVGTKAVSRDTEFKAVFTVNYEPGTLRAEVTLPASSAPLTATDAAASASSWQISATKLETAGLPAALRLTPDRTAIAADGQDLAYVTVEVVDKRGNVCPEAAIPCEATVRGAATLLAFATADLKDRELYTSPRVTTFQGRALLVVRSAKKGGRADVSIRSKLGTAKVGILCAHK